jgi:CDP-diacylglycerol---serine O-phosphatidyltransferase
LIALKFKNGRLSDNAFRYALLASGAFFLAWMQLAGLPLVILSYLALSILEQALPKK